MSPGAIGARLVRRRVLARAPCTPTVEVWTNRAHAGARRRLQQPLGAADVDVAVVGVGVAGGAIDGGHVDDRVRALDQALERAPRRRGRPRPSATPRAASAAGATPGAPARPPRRRGRAARASRRPPVYPVAPVSATLKREPPARPRSLGNERAIAVDGSRSRRSSARYARRAPRVEAPSAARARPRSRRRSARRERRGPSARRTSPGGTSKPERPSSITSTIPPVRDADAGRPQAAASTSERPRASKIDGNTKTSDGAQVVLDVVDAAGEGRRGRRGPRSRDAAPQLVLDATAPGPRPSPTSSEVRARLGRPPRRAKASTQRLEALAAQQPARVGDDAGVRRAARGARAAPRALRGVGGPEALGVDAVRDVARPARGGTPARHELVADQARHGHEGVGVAQQQVAQRATAPHDRAPRQPAGRARCPRCRPRPTARRSPRAAARPALPQRARGQQAGQAQHARPAHHQHVVARRARAAARGSARGHHRVLAARGPGPAGRTRTTRTPSSVSSRRPAPRPPRRVTTVARHARRATSAPRQVADVALAAAQDRMERLGQEEDARSPRRGSAGLAPRLARRSRLRSP